MSQTITRTPALSAPIVPDLSERSSYDATSEVRNQLIPIVGRTDVEVALFPAGLRAGTMLLLFSDRAAAFAALQAHREVGVFTLTDGDVPAASMTYVTAGTLQLTLDPDTGNVWLLRVGFQEVIA